jgi:hypothetical protein
MVMAYSIGSSGLIVALLSPSNFDYTRIDLLDFPVFPDDRCRTSLFRTLDDLPRGLSKSRVRQSCRKMR